MEIFKEFTFEAAHLLPNTPTGHKCRNLHGHSFRVEVRVTGPTVEPEGWVMDFADISAAWINVHAILDHRFINDVPGLENPTSENIAKWIWNKLRSELHTLDAVVVRETCASGCVYRGQ